MMIVIVILIVGLERGSCNARVKLINRLWALVKANSSDDDKEGAAARCNGRTPVCGKLGTRPPCEQTTRRPAYRADAATPAGRTEKDPIRIKIITLPADICRGVSEVFKFCADAHSRDGLFCLFFRYKYSTKLDLVHHFGSDNLNLIRS